MKHKLTVLACVSLALLLSTGFAFAQNSVVTVESKDVLRCATSTVNVYLDAVGDWQALGIPLVLTGPGTLTGVAAGPGLAGHMVAINHQGNRVLVNAATTACPTQGNHHVLTLTITTDDDCTGTISIGLDDPALVPTAGLVLTDCDACEIPVDLVAGQLTLVNRDPVCGVNTPENLHFSGAIVNKQLNASDPDACDNPVGFTLKAGSPGAVTPEGLYSWDPGCPDVGVHTITFIATDQCNASVECTFQVTVYHDPPTCDDLPLNLVHWRDLLVEPLPGYDDLCLLDPPAWSLIDVMPPVVGAIDVHTRNGPGDAFGELVYQAECLDIGQHEVWWQIDDGDFQAYCHKVIEVYNNAPWVQCPGLDTMNINLLYEGQVVGGDPDPQDVPFLEYTVIGVTLDGNPYVPVNAPWICLDCGWFTWQSTFADPAGHYVFTIQIDDGCYQATCEIHIELIQYFVDILDATGMVDTIPTLPGQTACAYVHMNNPNYELGGIDLLMAYDASCLVLQSVDVGDGLLDWEYWTWRHGASGNCEGGCPSGLVRVIAIADLDNGPGIHPPDPAFVLNGNIIELCFYVTSDWNFIGECCWIDFYSIDCGDNVLASKDGNILWMEIGVDPACLEGGGPDKPVPIEKITYGRGAICLREPQDRRGDLNLNNIGHEVADAVLYSNYFIQGDIVWDPVYFAVQHQASDVNNDGVQLTIADLVYLIRVITGDEMPFPDDAGMPKVSPYAGQADAIVKVGANQVTVTTNSAVDLGGAAFVFRYSGLGVGEAVASDAASEMVVKSRSDRGELRVLVAPPISDDLPTIEAGSHEVVSIPISGEGTIELVEVQLSDAHGALLNGHMAKVSPPKSYALLQNYPNPFNAGTVIPFDLKNASDWTVTVYNITGQVVRTFAGHNEASQVRVAWDGTDNVGRAVSSGVYFYRITANEFTATKKMTLLK